MSFLGDARRVGESVINSESIIKAFLLELIRVLRYNFLTRAPRLKMRVRHDGLA